MLEKIFNKETPRTWIYPPIKTTKNTDKMSETRHQSTKASDPEKQETNEVSPIDDPTLLHGEIFFFFEKNSLTVP